MATKRSTRTKAEVQQEFTAASAAARAAQFESPTEKLLREQREAQVRSNTKEISVEKALTNITALGFDVQKALATVSENLTLEVRQLEDLRAAVALEKEELERLYQIDLAKASFENLVAEYDQKRKELAAGHTEYLESLNRQIADAKESARLLELDTAKRRERDEEQYAYETAQRHRNIEDAFAQKMQQKDRELAQREQQLREREVRMAELEKQVAEMPVLIEKAEKKGAAIAESRLTKEFEHKFTLAQMEATNNAKIAEQNIVALNNTISSQAHLIESLRSDLAAANARAETIATKAVEASSGQQALAVAMQSAANRDNGLGNGKRA